MVYLDICESCGGAIDGLEYDLEEGWFPCLCGSEPFKPHAVESPFNEFEGQDYD